MEWNVLSLYPGKMIHVHEQEWILVVFNYDLNMIRLALRYLCHRKYYMSVYEGWTLFCSNSLAKGS